MKTIRVGLVGSQFIAAIHLEALRAVPYTEVVAVCSATEAHARAFAERHGIGRWFNDYRRMFALPEIDIVVLGLPNDLHCDATLAAAAAGKHVICEKPLCLNLDEADRMIAACREAKVKLMYAEELCFTPKSARDGPLHRLRARRPPASVHRRRWPGGARGGVRRVRIRPPGPPHRPPFRDERSSAHRSLETASSIGDDE